MQVRRAKQAVGVHPKRGLGKRSGGGGGVRVPVGVEGAGSRCTCDNELAGLGEVTEHGGGHPRGSARARAWEGGRGGIEIETIEKRGRKRKGFVDRKRRRKKEMD
jgi:hypothetical protein